MTNDTPASAQPQTVAEAREAAIRAFAAYGDQNWEVARSQATTASIGPTADCIDAIDRLIEAARREARTEAAGDTPLMESLTENGIRAASPTAANPSRRGEGVE